MDDGEEGEEQSQTVTIALDLPPSGGDRRNDGTDQPQQQLEQQQLLTSRNEGLQQQQQNAKLIGDETDAFLVICPPPSSADLLRPWRRKFRQNANADENSDNKNCKKGTASYTPGAIVRVRHLRAEMAQLLEQRLNPPGCGSMRNWEFVAAHLGLDTDQIVQMRRRTKNPMSALMRRFCDEPLLRFLELIGEAERIDVLISIRQFAEKPMSADDCHLRAPQSLSDSALIKDSGDSSSTGHYSPPHTSSTAVVRSLINNASVGGSQAQQQQQQRFILILHHENERNRELRKFHRLLLKNLDVYAKEEGIKIVDIDQCMSDQDLLGSVSRHFERADQVVMELSPDYAELISTVDQMSTSDSDQQQLQIDQRVRMKLYLHQMTYSEVLFNANQNRRFRVVLMQGCRPEHIPRGWPGNTLHYRFPQDFEALCQRLFDQQQRQQQQAQQKTKMMMMTN